MSNNWKSKNRHKFLLQYHLIFVCKYRKKLFTKEISDDIKHLSYKICQRHNVIIHKMETDKDHIYYMIETEPTISISDLVRMMKSYITYHIWKSHKKLHVKTFLERKYILYRWIFYICSIGNVSEKTITKIYKKSRIK